MTWVEFKKFSGIITVVTSLLAIGLSALALNLTRNDVETSSDKEEGAIKAIVEEHGKALSRIENKVDQLLLLKAK
jgi:hypothetical protein